MILRAWFSRVTRTMLGALGLSLVVLTAACGDNIKTEVPATVDAVTSTVTVEPTTARADGQDTAVVTVTVRDAAGEPLAGMAVSIAASGEGTTVTQPEARTGVDGVAWGTVAATIAGTVPVSVVVSNGVDEVPLAQHPEITFLPVADHLVFQVPPSDVIAGTALAPAVQVAVVDNVGTVLSDVETTITLALADNPGNDTLGGTLSVDTVAGVAEFSDLVLERAGAGYTLTATASGITDAVSDPFTVLPAAPERLAFRQQPSDAIAGQSVTPPVEVVAYDAFDNEATTSAGWVTVALAANATGATLGGTTTRALNAGVAVFHDLTLDRVGTGYTLAATSAGLTATESDAFAVSAAGAVTLELTGVPDPVTAGAAQTLVVTARDRFGNVVTDFAHTVTFTSSDTAAALPSLYAFTAADHGTHAFPGVTLKTAGVQSLNATSQSDVGVRGSVTVNVTPAPAASLRFETEPPAGTAGVALTPAVTVSLRDAFGNLAATSTTRVALELATSPTSAVLGGGEATLPVAGVATFAFVTCDKAGAYTLRATAPGLTAATSASFTVSASAPASLGFLVEPSDVAAGAAMAPAVQVAVFDAFGNRVTTATSAVSLAIQSGPTGGTLSGLGPVVPTDGIASFAAVTGTRVGTYTLAATAGTLPAALSRSFTIAPAAGDHLAFLTPPSDATAGAAIAPTVVVEVRDQYDNLVPTATSAISLELVTGPAGATVAGVGPVAAVAGQAAFPALTLVVAGSYTLRATTGALQSPASASFTITPAAPTKLAFLVQPTDLGPGATMSPAVAVAVQDSFGNTVPVTTPAIGLQLSGGNPAAVLTGGDAVAPVAGVATFAALSVDLPGSDFMLVASHPTFATAYSMTFNVFGAPDHLAFTIQPGNSPANGPFSVAVAVKDAAGATIKSDNTTAVTVALDANPGMATLGGTLTQTATQGVAVFTGLTVDVAGSGYVLGATGGGLAPATSDPFTIFGAPAQLAFVTQPPADVDADAPFGVAVEVQDIGGRLVEDATNDVTIGVETGPNGAAVLGTTTRAAVAGRATFTGLRLQIAGSTTLNAAATGLTDAVSAPVTVRPAAAASLVLAGLPATITAGAPATVTVTARDTFGNVATSYRGTVGFTSTDPSAVLAGPYAFTAVDAGVHVFTNGVDLRTAGSRTVTVTDTTTATLTATQTTTVEANVAAGYAVAPLGAQTAGVAFGLSLSVKDAYNNTVTGYTGTVAFTSSDSQAILPGDYTFTTGDAGTHTFASAITLKTAGTQSLTLSQTPGAAITTTLPVTVLPAAATQLAFTVQPGWTPMNTIIAPAVKVAIQDAYGNTRSSDAAAITVSLGGSSSGTLGGTTTVATVAGVATFANLTVDTTGVDFVLGASATGFTDTASSSFAVYKIPEAGDFRITEVMHSPTGGAQIRQWFEIRNVTDDYVDVKDLVVTDTVSGGGFTVDFQALLDPRAHFVLGASADAGENGGVTNVSFKYGSALTLGAKGHLTLEHGSTLVDEVSWDATFPHTVGYAMSLSANAQGGVAPQYPWWWCDATAQLSGGDYGSPGTTNPVCGTAASEPLDLCRLVSPLDLGTIEAGTVQDIVGRFAEAGVTDRDTCNDFYPFIEGEVGMGAAGSDPTTDWTWGDIDYDPTYTSGCTSSEDQAVGQLTFTYGGAQAFGYRFRLVDPDTLVRGPWTYCDRAGIAATPATGNYGTASVQQCSPGSQLVISQVYGGGGNAGATLTSDFIELHNRGTTAVDVTGWSVQYASASGISWQVTPLSGVIPPGGYYLVAEAAGSGGTVSLPTPDAIGSIPMSATAGKVALVASATALTDACPTTVDFVGFGSADCAEGTAVGALSNTTAALRNADGSARAACVDSNDNAADFTVAAPVPRNSAATANHCGCQGP